MSIPAKVVRDSARLFLFQVLGRGLTVVSTIVIGRVLGVENYGLLAYSLTVVYFLSLFMEFGISPYMIRSLVQNMGLTSEMFGASLVVKLLQGLFATLFVILPILLIWYRSQGSFIYVLLLLPLFEAVYLSSVAVLNSAEEFSGVARLGLIYDVMRGGSALLLALLFRSIFWVAAGYLVSAVLVSVLAFLSISRRNLIRGMSASVANVLGVYKGSFWFFLYAIAFQVYFKIDVVMLDLMRGHAEVGIYSAAYKFFEIFLFGPAILMGVLFPRFARLSGTVDFAQESKQAQKFLMTMGMPVVLVIFLFAHPIVRLTFGEAFEGSVLPLRVLIFTLGIYLFNCVFPMALNSTGHERETLKAIAVGIIANIAMNLYAIPRFGALGASLSTLAAEVLVTFAYSRYYLSLFAISGMIEGIWKPVLLTGVIIGVSYLITDFTLWLRLALVISLYVAGGALLGIIRKSDVALLRSLVFK